jgi:hypothetical protein
VICITSWHRSIQDDTFKFLDLDAIFDIDSIASVCKYCYEQLAIHCRNRLLSKVTYITRQLDITKD